MIDPSSSTPLERPPHQQSVRVARFGILLSCATFTTILAHVVLGPTLAGAQPATTQAPGSSADEPSTSERVVGEDGESLEYIELTLTVLETDRKTADEFIAKSLPRGSSLPNLMTLAVTRSNDQYVDSMADLAKRTGLSLLETREVVMRLHTCVQLEVGGNFLVPASSPRSQENSIPLFEPTFIGWTTQINPRILPGGGESTRVRLDLVGKIRELRPHSGPDNPIREYDVRMAIDAPLDEFIVISNRSGDSALVLILQLRTVVGPLPAGIVIEEKVTIRVDPASGIPIDPDLKDESGDNAKGAEKSQSLQGEDDSKEKLESGLREELLRLRNLLDRLLKSPALRDAPLADG